MITRETSEGLVCVHQVDHARLAGRFADWWGGAALPHLEPRDSVLHAVANHDAGWPDLDEVPAWDPRSGRPHTYQSHGLADSLGVAERSVQRVAAVDPYAGWLVSRHFASMHESGEREAKDWVGEQVARQAALVGQAAGRVPAAALEPRVLEANFDWLQLLDALSLAVIRDWDTWESRSMARDYEGSMGVFRYRRYGSSTPRAVVGTVDPYPFIPVRLTEQLPVRILPGLHWIGADTLTAAWHEARIVTVEVALTAG
ncbi:MAG: DUF3891 family protein [Gemmatimonadetes bacterium]|nr:DUF3891 family protein [Gemmatimonadota bacterium]